MKRKFLGILICTLLIAPLLSGIGIGYDTVTLSFKEGGSRSDTNMTISIIPFNPPITISQYGGNYKYTIETINNENNSMSFDIWTMYTLPNGSSYGPVFGPVDVLLPEKWSGYNENLTDYLQATMPGGNYTLTAYVGNYSGTIWDSDNFTFYKLPSDGGWYYQNPGNDEDLEAVSFADENNGWAVGYDTIMHTTDGGDSWFEQDDGQYYNVGYVAVDFVDSQTGWIGGGLIQKTTDGGNTWTEQYDPGSSSVHGLFFLDANNGYAVGGRYDTYNGIYNRYIKHTSDGGDNWNTQLYESGAYYDPVGPLRDIFFIDADHGWAVGDFGAVFSTSDGGVNWIEQYSGLTEYYNDLYGVSFGDVNNGWAVGEQGTMIYTTDAGSSWSNYSPGFYDDFTSIVFTDANNGWIAGGGYDPYHATILHTDDGGNTWNLQDTGTGDLEFYLNDIDFVNSDMGWAAGGTWYPFEGVMLHTENGGGTDVNPILSYTPSSIDFGEMYGSQSATEILTIWNSGTGTLTYNLYPEPSKTWITTDPENGFSMGEQDQIDVIIDTGGLQPGQYVNNLTISSNAGTVIVPIYVTILESNPILAYDPHSHDFGDVPQYDLVTTNLSIWNNGTGVMYYWIDDFDTFCVVEPWSGSSDSGEVNNHTIMCFTSGLAPGPHQCNLTIYAGDAGTGIVTIYVNVTSGGVNSAPSDPYDPLPSNDTGTNGETDPVLSVIVTDPDSDMMTVSFYDSSDDSLIGTDLNVMSGMRAYARWEDLSINSTYGWYAVAHDQEDTAQSDAYSFTVDEANNSSFTVNVTLMVGWNMIGWYRPYDTLASSIMDSIPSCIMISWYDAVNQTFKTRTTSGGYDFIVTPGLGLFVYTTDQTYWNGEG